MIIPIIGGGPAGMSCALWLHNFGFRPIIIEQAAALGGMARASPYPNEWLLGRPGEARARTRTSSRAISGRRRSRPWLGARPRRIRRGGDGGFALEVGFADARAAQSWPCPAVVIATGTKFRGEEWLDRVANARPLAAAGRVHLGPPWAGEPGAEPGAHVAVIGGGDNAFDVSRMLAERGVRATIVMRSKRPRAQPLLVERLRRHEASGWRW